MPERLKSHHRAQIASSNPDINDIANTFARVPFPFSTANSIRESSHLVQDPVHFRYYIFSIDHDGCVPGGSESAMQNRAIFGDIDLVATKHGIDALSHAADFSQLNEQTKRLVSDAILREIQEETYGLRRHPLAAVRVIRKELPQVQVANFPKVSCQISPRLSLCRRCGDCSGRRHSLFVSADRALSIACV